MSGKKQKYAVIGWPVEHSVSPQMQNAAFESCAIPASYERIPTPPEKLSETIDRLRFEGFCGCNITVPHKETVAPLLDELSPEAELAGSVNTIVVCNGKLHGYSTDGCGLEEAIMEAFAIKPAGKNFFFIGAGGATRATAAHLARQGAAKIWIINRTLDKASRICKLINTSIDAGKADAFPLEKTETWHPLINSADVIIQATSLGLKDTDPLPVPPETLGNNKNIYDMIYRLTPFQQAAIKHQCRVANGEGMLLYQGAKSFEIWTGRNAPVEAMRQALRTALAERS